MTEQLFWRIQGRPEAELTHASWHAYLIVGPLEPADEWPGFWWADSDGLEVLIREEDVASAREGEYVHTYAPGLYGCDSPVGLLAYFRQMGVRTPEDADGLYVALYAGRLLWSAFDGEAFSPHRLLFVLPAPNWLRRQLRARGDESL